MSKINNLDFAALNLSGDNYLQWALDAKIILKSKGLGECITEDNNASEKDRYSAILIIRHHLIESLIDQYLTIENPLDLWTELKMRYDHQRTVLLPKAIFDWRNPESRNISPWMSLLLAGKNNGLLMRNSELRPPGLTPLPDTNKAAEKKR